MTTGITYYSEFKSTSDIFNPILNNDVNMATKGYFDVNWIQSDVSFDNPFYGITKTLTNRGLIYCDDSSKLFSMNKGYVGIKIKLNHGIANGIYHLLSESREFNDFILWGVNVGKQTTSKPGFYVALTTDGIKFKIQCSSCEYSVVDTYTSYVSGDILHLEFLWNSAGLDDLAELEGFEDKITVLYRVNGQNLVVGNPPIANDSLSGLNFCLGNTPFLFSNLEMTIGSVTIGNDLPNHLIEELQSSSSSSSSS